MGDNPKTAEMLFAEAEELAKRNQGPREWSIIGSLKTFFEAIAGFFKSIFSWIGGDTTNGHVTGNTVNRVTPAKVDSPVQDTVKHEPINKPPAVPKEPDPPKAPPIKPRKTEPIPAVPPVIPKKEPLKKPPEVEKKEPPKAPLVEPEKPKPIPRVPPAVPKEPELPKTPPSKPEKPKPIPAVPPVIPKKEPLKKPPEVEKKEPPKAPPVEPEKPKPIPPAPPAVPKEPELPKTPPSKPEKTEPKKPPEKPPEAEKETVLDGNGMVNQSGTSLKSGALRLTSINNKTLGAELNQSHLWYNFTVTGTDKTKVVATLDDIARQIDKKYSGIANERNGYMGQRIDVVGDNGRPIKESEIVLKMSKAQLVQMSSIETTQDGFTTVSLKDGRSVQSSGKISFRVDDEPMDIQKARQYAAIEAAKEKALAQERQKTELERLQKELAEQQKNLPRVKETEEGNRYIAKLTLESLSKDTDPKHMDIVKAAVALKPGTMTWQDVNEKGYKHAVIVNKDGRQSIWYAETRIYKHENRVYSYVRFRNKTNPKMCADSCLFNPKSNDPSKIADSIEESINSVIIRGTETNLKNIYKDDINLLKNAVTAIPGATFKEVKEDSYNYALVLANGDTWYVRDAKSDIIDKDTSNVPYQVCFVNKNNPRMVCTAPAHTPDLITHAIREAYENAANEKADAADAKHFDLPRNKPIVYIAFSGMGDDANKKAFPNSFKKLFIFPEILRKCGYDIVCDNNKRVVELREHPGGTFRPDGTMEKKGVIRENIDYFHKQGARSFFLNFEAHGDTEGIDTCWNGATPGSVKKDRLEAAQLEKILLEYPDCDFVINTAACHAGGLNKMMRKIQDLQGTRKGRITVITHSKEAKINRDYYADIMDQGLVDMANGVEGAAKAYGPAHLRADQETQDVFIPEGNCNPEFLRSGGYNEELKKSEPSDRTAENDLPTENAPVAESSALAKAAEQYHSGYIPKIPEFLPDNAMLNPSLTEAKKRSNSQDKPDFT